MVGQKETLVFVSGKFRVIHTGHLRFLRLARKLGSKLIVGLDASDLSEEEIAWRVDALSNLKMIDNVETYDGNLLSLLGRLKPDIILKGKEFSEVKNEESEYIQATNAKLLFSSGDSFFSEYDMFDESAQNLDLGTKQIKVLRDLCSRYQIDVGRISEILQEAKALRVLVVGDLIVDEFINCHPLGMSSEEPVVAVTPVDKKRFLGGAGIVAAHASALGSKTTLVSCFGDDEVGAWAREKLQEYGVSQISAVDQSRPTTLKQRYRSGSYTLLKVSHLRQDPISNDLIDGIMNRILERDEKFDIVIFSDFSYGVCHVDLVDRFLEQAKAQDIFTAADSQSSSQIGDLSKFKNVHLLTPTERELRNEMRDQVSGLVFVGEALQKRLNAKYVFVKVGADGLILHAKNQIQEIECDSETERIPSLASTVVDSCGAGDSLLAVSSICFKLGLTAVEAALAGSCAAAIQVSRLGNIPVEIDTLVEFLNNLAHSL